jgi:hypothetical protein
MRFFLVGRARLRPLVVERSRRILPIRVVCERRSIRLSDVHSWTSYRYPSLLVCSTYLLCVRDRSPVAMNVVLVIFVVAAVAQLCFAVKTKMAGAGIRGRPCRRQSCYNTFENCVWIHDEINIEGGWIRQ